MGDSVDAPRSGGGEGTAPQEVLQDVSNVETKAINQNVEPANQESALAEPKPVKDEPKSTVEEATPIVESKPALEELKLAVEEPKPATEEAKAAEEPKPAVISKQDESRPVEETTLAQPAKLDGIIDQNGNSVDQSSTAPVVNDWQQRESELLKKIDELEKVKDEKLLDSLRLIKVREEEIDLLKTRVRNLETELQATLTKPGAGKNHEIIEKIKQQHEELLNKARGMIFDKTKMVKNQELQIEALTTQVQSLKDINQITKDLLDIRNSEVKAMEDRFQAMDARFKAEKERFGLVLKRAQTSTNINDDLRKEYETQLNIFKELREKYEQRVNALVAENERLKQSLPANAPTTS